MTLSHENLEVLIFHNFFSKLIKIKWTNFWLIHMFLEKIPIFLYFLILDQKTIRAWKRKFISWIKILFASDCSFSFTCLFFISSKRKKIFHQLLLNFHLQSAEYSIRLTFPINFAPICLLPCQWLINILLFCDDFVSFFLSISSFFFCFLFSGFRFGFFLYLFFCVR